MRKTIPWGTANWPGCCRPGKIASSESCTNMGSRLAASASAYIYPGKAAQIAPNKLREEGMDLLAHEVVFSDILEIKLADGTRVRGCFALRHRTREVLGIAFDYHMRADLVVDPSKPSRLRFLIPSGIATKASSMELRRRASCSCARGLFSR